MDHNQASSNITQILASFDDFVSVLESSQWISTAKAEDIKNGFKLGFFLEKTLNHFQDKNFLYEFLNVLNHWWKLKNRTKVYDENFFLLACDQLLIRFFQNENAPETSIEIAVRVYTSIFPKARLKKVINDLILISSSREAITSFAKANIPKNELKTLEYSIVTITWSDILRTGREDDVRKLIENNLSLYKVESSLHLLIGVLSIHTVVESEKKIQNIILENLLQKMLDRNLLSKTFWLTMFRKVELLYITRACENFHEFMLSIFNFIVYSGSMMKNQDVVWVSDETVSLCPEITYDELLRFIKSIYNTSLPLKDFVIKRLINAEESTDSTIWKKIKQDLCL